MIVNRVDREAQPARTAEPFGLLRLALRLDAAVSGLAGVLGFMGGSALGDLLGLTPGQLAGVSAFFVLYALVVGGVSLPERISRLAASAIIVANVGWSATTVLTVVAGWLPLTLLGEVLTVFLALVVAGLAAVQLLGVRRSWR